MNRILFSQNLNKRRKEMGFTSIQNLASKYDELFTPEYNKKNNK